MSYFERYRRRKSLLPCKTAYCILVLWFVFAYEEYSFPCANMANLDRASDIIPCSFVLLPIVHKSFPLHFRRCKQGGLGSVARTRNKKETALLSQGRDMMTQLDFSAPGPETRWLLLTTRSQPSFYIFFSLCSASSVGSFRWASIFYRTRPEAEVRKREKEKTGREIKSEDTCGCSF